MSAYLSILCQLDFSPAGMSTNFEIKPSKCAIINITILSKDGAVALNDTDEGGDERCARNGNCPHNFSCLVATTHKEILVGGRMGCYCWIVWHGAFD